MQEICLKIREEMNKKMEASCANRFFSSWKFIGDGDTDTDNCITRLKIVRNSNLGSVIRCLIHSVTDKRSLRVGDTVSDTEWQ